MSAKLPIPNLTFSPLGMGGLAIPGARLYTYVAGTTTNQATFTDETGVSANTNPVILDSNGQANVWLTPGVSYRFDLYDANGVLLRTTDNVPGGTLAGQSSVTANYVFAGPTTGSAAAPAFRPLVAADIPDVSGVYALATLANLGVTSINAALLAQTGIDLGSPGAAFRFLYLWGAGTFGSTSLRLGGTPTGVRQLTLPDATDTLVGRATTDTLTNKTLTQPIIADFTNANHTHQSAAQGGLLPPLKNPVNVLSVDTAISPHTSGFYVITKGSAAHNTLAAPTVTTDDGVTIEISSDTAFAHVLTATGLLQTGAAAVNTATCSAFAGASLILRAYQGLWLVISQNQMAFA